MYSFVFLSAPSALLPLLPHFYFLVHRYVIATGEVNLAMFFIDRGKVDILSHSTSTSTSSTKLSSSTNINTKLSSSTNINTLQRLSKNSKISFEDTKEDTKEDMKEDDTDEDASPGGTMGRQEMIFATLNTGDFFGEKVRQMTTYFWTFRDKGRSKMVLEIPLKHQVRIRLGAIE